jgi:hypothetical protein
LSFEKAVGLEFLFFIIIRTFMIIENRYINSILLCIFKHHYSMPMACYFLFSNEESPLKIHDLEQIILPQVYL